ncbi:MAG TPA: UBP-type zinc finger domain-containing protein [Devosia sp.]|nr:UBP-type zinc finger domain-containing protein [Devosia sp.]
MKTCGHLSLLRETEPSSADACAECLAAGSSWVHLRICLTCGHVACCDSSPNRHARKHFHASGHPLIGSYEPGETWRYCYADDAMLEPAREPPRRR